MKKENKKTNKAISEIIEIGSKTLLSAIPLGGALITSVWDSVKSNSAQKRLENWQNLIEERLATVECTLEEIGQNENFTTAILNATEIAVKTAEKEKHICLANAVFNALSCDIEESVMMMFMNIINNYTAMHIKTLIFLNEPERFLTTNFAFITCTPKTLLYDAYPELAEHDKLVDKIINDLYNDGLISTHNLTTTMTYQGAIAPRTTELGNQFIEFFTYNT